MAVSALAACSDGDDTAMGSLSVSLMDRSVDDVTEVSVTIAEMLIKPAGDGPAVPLQMPESPIQVNLLELNDLNASVLVDNVQIPAGTYNWLELQIEDDELAQSFVMTNEGGMFPVDVDVPGGRLRLVSRFEVPEGEALRILLDWDVRKGLNEAVGQDRFLLRPTFRVLDVDAYGAIVGTVSGAQTIAVEPSCADVIAPEDSGKVVYVFEGDVLPDDIDGQDAEPVTSVDAQFDAATGDYAFRAVVMPGTYTVAFTCEGALDDDDTDDAITFIDAVAVDVVAATETVSIEF